MEVFLSKNIGYCFGVNKAIDLIFHVKNSFPNNQIYLFGQIIHNSFFINELEKNNIKVVDFNSNNAISILENFKKDDIVIFSAHGHDEKYDEILNKKSVKFFDATCPIVNHNLKIIKNSKKPIIFIGKKGHPETEASLSFSENIFLYDINGSFDYSLIKSEDPLVLNQTTLSILELTNIISDIKNHYKNAKIVDEVCMQTRLRQVDVIDTDDSFDLLVIIGDKKSSNSKKLYEVAKEKHPKKCVLFIENYKDLLNYQLTSCKKAKIFSGTSTPMILIDEVKEYLMRL